MRGGFKDNQRTTEQFRRESDGSSKGLCLALLIKKYHNEKIDFFKAWNIFLKKGIYL
jgi:hypothetical protein